MKQKTIGQVAKTLNINVETIRFYEREGLIQQPEKPAQGFRHYSDKIVSRIRFIRRAQELGFSLKDIRQLLSLDNMPCGKVESLAESKLELVREKIKDLQRLELALEAMVKACKTNPDKSDCPVIDTLASPQSERPIE